MCSNNKNSCMNDMEKLRNLITEINCLYGIFNYSLNILKTILILIYLIEFRKCPKVREKSCCVTKLPPRVIELPSLPKKPYEFQCPRPLKSCPLTSIPRPCCTFTCPGSH